MKTTLKNIETKDREVRQLVIERLKVFPNGRRISIGSEGEFTKNDLIEHVENNDSIGKTIIKVQLNFLQSLKTGVLLEDE